MLPAVSTVKMRVPICSPHRFRRADYREPDVNFYLRIDRRPKPGISLKKAPLAARSDTRARTSS